MCTATCGSAALQETHGNGVQCCVTILPCMQDPLDMTCRQGHVLLLSAPMHMLLLRADISGNLRQPKRASVTFTAVRELCLACPVPASCVVALVADHDAATQAATQGGNATGFARGGSTAAPMPAASAVASDTSASEPTSPAASPRGVQQAVLSRNSDSGGRSSPRTAASFGAHSVRADWRRSAPTRCALLRSGGAFSILNLDTGHETHLLNVRCCFVRDGAVARGLQGQIG